MAIEPLLLCSTDRRMGDAAPTSPPKPHPAISISLQALLDWNHILQAKQNTSSYEDGNTFENVGRELRVDPPTIFCRPCRDLLKSPPKPGEQFVERARDWVPFHRNMFDLIYCCHDPRGNCPLCQQFWKSIKHTTSAFRIVKKGLRVILPERGLKVCLQVQKVNMVEDGQVEEKDDFNLTLNLLVRKDDCDHYPVGVCFNYNEREQHSSRIDFSFANCADSDTTFSHVENWTQECSERHAQCRINHDLFPSNPPARLIYIESSGNRFRLEESQRPEELQESQNSSAEHLRLPKYTALSYRWGTKASFMLKKDTLDGMREWRSISLLPKTLRDACATTIRLRLRHIWIDRLCIIQDSKEDWECESSKMADVYRNAWCTISATGSRDDNGGCYFHRNPLEILPLRLVSNPFVDGCFSLDKETYYNLNHDRMICDYLGDRAWTFQERNLSRRILHFAKNQVYWQCRESNACETRPSFNADMSSRSISVSEIKSDDDALHRWTDIVREYSWGKLSNKEDKLPALSGMAAEMYLASNDNYLAGLWRKHILFHLCWVVKSQHPERPKLYRAPSWSWASLDSVIENYAAVRQFLNRRDRDFRRRPQSTSLNLNHYNDTGFQEIASIEDIQVEPLSGSNPYSQVKSGWIKISSHLFQVSIPVEIIRSRQYREIKSPNGQPLKLVYGSTVFLDSHHVFLSGETVPTFCLALLYDEDDEPFKKLYCLVLAPYSHSLCQRPESEASIPSSNINTRYQRVGLVTLDFMSNGCYNFLEQCTKQTVIIL